MTDLPLLQLVARLANALDLKDWGALRACLADRLHVDDRDVQGAAGPLDADAYVAARLERLAGLVTHHVVSNLELDRQGERATCRASLTIQRWRGEQAFHTHAVHELELRAGEGGRWLVAGIRARILRDEGEPALLEGAATARPHAPRRLPVVGRAGAPLGELLRGAGLLPEEGSPGRPATSPGLLERNRARALGVLREQLEGLRARLDRVRLEPAEFERRATLALRALDEAGRHPDDALRVALGTLARRVLVEGCGAVPSLEALELLGRLTALDLALLDVAVGAGVVVLDAAPAARFVVGDPAPGFELERPRPTSLPPNVKRPDELARGLSRRVPDASPERLRLASHRLRRLGLFHAEHVYGGPTEAGREVLRLSTSSG